MKGYTGKLVIKFTAKVRSMAQLEKRCQALGTQAERTIGCEWWGLCELIELPGPIPLGYYGVQLCTVPNPALGQTEPPVPAEWVIVETLSAAKAAVRDYLTCRPELVGAANWSTDSGRVWDHQGEVVARFSYNLRCWMATSGEEVELRP